MLTKEIEKLISLEQEGPYWDFKRECYIDSGNLLHASNCMANNLESRDAYIIIGVDEGNNFTTVDISKYENRKNTQKITDFLKDKKFAGGIRPQIYVKSVCIQSSQLDVIVIKNSYHTPFYL